ncbi:unnamed protein product, partial [Ectocarpus fasciculatus]
GAAAAFPGGSSGSRQEGRDPRTGEGGGSGGEAPLSPPGPRTVGAQQSGTSPGGDSTAEGAAAPGGASGEPDPKRLRLST